jgi:hypothetical protein
MNGRSDLKKKTSPTDETDFDYMDDDGETETGQPTGLIS